MLKIDIDNIGDLAIVECAGRIVQSEAAFKLRDAVTSQSDARTVVLELTEVPAIEGGGLGMLIFLQRWARDHGVRFKLFNPTPIRQIGVFYLDCFMVAQKVRRAREVNPATEVEGH